MQTLHRYVLPTKVFTDLAGRGQGSPPPVSAFTMMAIKAK